MEGKEEISFGVKTPPTMAANLPVNFPGPISDIKKKRGRPRKYGPDGAVAGALSPMPISASIPLTGDLSGWKQSRVRPYQPVKKAHKLEFQSVGTQLAYILGGNFTPHVITVGAGEDITSKIISFSQRQPHAVCVLSACGAIAHVTLRQPNSSGGTLTYEGRFEILSLTGSFMPADNSVTRSRTGGISVSLAGPGGRVVGGGLAGLLVAATPVQIVLGSFMYGHQLERLRKLRTETLNPVIPALVSPVSQGGSYGGQKVNLNLGQDSKELETDNNISSLEGDSEDDDDDDDHDDVDDNDNDNDVPSNLEISG